MIAKGQNQDAGAPDDDDDDDDDGACGDHSTINATS